MCAFDVRTAIGTERLILRAPVMDDAAAIAELANDPGVVGMLADWPYPFGEDEAMAWLMAVTGADPRRGAHFIIEHRQFGVIGVISVADAERDGGKWARPELAYWLGRPFWNRGYATEAVEAVLRWVKADWRRQVVWAGHFADNRASGQVLVKAGFLYTGDVAMRACAGRGGAVVADRQMVWLA